MTYCISGWFWASLINHSCAIFCLCAYPQEQKLTVLQARLAECDQAMTELEQAASNQMHGLVQQSTQTLEKLQSKLTLTESQLHQLRTFTEVSGLS